jgi:hypothetical protein
VVERSGIFLAGSLGSFFTDQFPHSLQVFLPNRDNGFGRGAVYTQNAITYHLHRYLIVQLEELVVFLPKFEFNGFNVVID